jgi:hypothetical protein
VAWYPRNTLQRCSVFGFRDEQGIDWLMCSRGRRGVMSTLNKYQTAHIISQLSDIEQFVTQMLSLNSEGAREMCRGHAFTRTRDIRQALLGVALADIEVEAPVLAEADARPSRISGAAAGAKV